MKQLLERLHPEESSRRRWRRLECRSRVALDYARGVAVKIILEDHKCHVVRLYSILREFNVPRRQRSRP